jgi:uncharacterized protein YbcI
MADIEQGLHETGKHGQGRRAAMISDGLVHLHKEYYGRGPTEAKTFLVNDTVIALLRGGFTPIEKALIAEGQGERVHEMRRSFQHLMRERFEAIVEKATGRRVIAYMSQIHSDPDIALECFTLEPGPPLLDAEESIKELEEAEVEIGSST